MFCRQLPTNCFKMTKSEIMRSPYVCINCGEGVKELHKKYSNIVKAINCDKCHKVADKYIEFEPVIIIVDAMLLSQQVYRHALYNREFKLFWKLSLMLLLLESLTLWREKKEQQLNGGLQPNALTHENGFYFCCALKLCGLYNVLPLYCYYYKHQVADVFVCVILLLVMTMALRPKQIDKTGLQQYCFQLFKANTLANFSKFFLLPIMLWRENTTDFGVSLHRTLVTGHHICSLVFVYKIVSNFRALQATLIVIPVYIVKELIMQFILQSVENNFSELA